MNETILSQLSDASGIPLGELEEMDDSMIVSFPDAWALYNWLYVEEATDTEGLVSGVMDLFTFEGNMKEHQMAGHAFLLSDERIYEIDGMWYYIAD